MSPKSLKLITQTLLLSVIAVVPFLFTESLYFPYVSGKVYVFRTLVALAFFFWVWLFLKEKEYPSTSLGASKPNFKNILVISLILFFLAQVLVSFFGVDPLLSFFSTIERADGVLQYGLWLLYFLMLTSVFRKEQDWKLFFSVFIIIAFLLSVYSLINLKEQVRLYAIFGNSSYLAVFLLFAIGFCAIAIERKFINNRLNYLFFIPAVFFVITLIFTQTRGAYAGLVGGIFLFCLLMVLSLRKENKKLAFGCGIILFLGVLSIAALFLARETDFVQKRTILRNTTAVAKLWEYDVLRERLLVWQIAWKGFKEKPIFGWGPESFWSAANKYYDYRVGMAEPWFDRAHNQPIDILATGGIVLFSFYIFWLGAVIYTIFKIAKPGSRISASSPSANKFGQSPAEISLPGKDKKILSFILASIFLAYFLQGLFLFDILPTFLGLFPFLAFLVVVASRQPLINADEKLIAADRIRINQPNRHLSASKKSALIISIAGLLSLFIVWATVLLPYKANVFALKFLAYTDNGTYQGTRQFLEQSFTIKSPYTFWEVRKRSGWQLVSVWDYNITSDEISPEDSAALKEIYDYIIPELEKFVENRPYDPQIYFILGKAYRLGFEKLGKNDLDKAEKVLKEGRNYSESRIEYYSELVQVLILEEKFEEVEDLIKIQIEKISIVGDSIDNYNYVALGNLYFVAEKYDLAWEQYEIARNSGYKFYDDPTDYARYMKTAEEKGEYQKIVDTASAYLEKIGPDADTYFNIAVGYLNLGEKEKAKEFFLKAVELKKEYEEYRPFFE